MRLRVLVPTHIEVDEEVDKVSAEGLEGAFCILPRHLDWVSGLVPGLLSYEKDGQEVFLAINGGALVKCGDVVSVSTWEAAGGTDLEAIEKTVEESYKKLSEREERAQMAVAKIEADFVRRLVELEEND